MVVRRPSNAKDFNGTVFVEWVNVTAQQDFDQHWAPTYQEIMREGAAYVAVSAQAAGIRHLQAFDPVRYGSLVHPGDDYSYDPKLAGYQNSQRFSNPVTGVVTTWPASCTR